MPATQGLCRAERAISHPDRSRLDDGAGGAALACRVRVPAVGGSAPGGEHRRRQAVGGNGDAYGAILLGCARAAAQATIPRYTTDYHCTTIHLCPPFSAVVRTSTTGIHCSVDLGADRRTLIMALCIHVRTGRFGTPGCLPCSTRACPDRRRARPHGPRRHPHSHRSRRNPHSGTTPMVRTGDTSFFRLQLC